MFGQMIILEHLDSLVYIIWEIIELRYLKFQEPLYCCQGLRCLYLTTYILISTFGWHVTEKSWGLIWFKGYIYNYSNPTDFANRIYRYIKDNNTSELSKILSDVDGHFAIVIKADDLLFAAVDRIRSIPLFFVDRQSAFLLTDQPNRIVGKLNRSELTLNSQAKLMMSMSGFCSRDSTLISGLKQLQSGEYLKFENRKKLNILKYYKYHPINPEKDKSELFLKKN